MTGQIRTRYGYDGGNANGGGVYISSKASPTLRNVIISGCSITGGNGGSGAAAVDFNTPAGRGGWGGWARGGGAYIDSEASPTFISCTIRDNIVTGGNGGNGGNYAEGDWGYQPGGYGGNWSNDF